MVSIRAVYHNGQLQLLDPVELSEGQEVHVQILNEREQVQRALADLQITPIVSDMTDFDEADLQRQIDASTQGVTLSDLIIEERHSGR